MLSFMKWWSKMKKTEIQVSLPYLNFERLLSEEEELKELKRVLNSAFELNIENNMLVFNPHSILEYLKKNVLPTRYLNKEVVILS